MSYDHKKTVGDGEKVVTHDHPEPNLDKGQGSLNMGVDHSNNIAHAQATDDEGNHSVRDVDTAEVLLAIRDELKSIRLILAHMADVDN